jgi:hypothetical protein
MGAGRRKFRKEFKEEAVRRLGFGCYCSGRCGRVSLICSTGSRVSIRSSKRAFLWCPTESGGRRTRLSPHVQEPTAKTASGTGRMQRPHLCRAITCSTGSRVCGRLSKRAFLWCPIESGGRRTRLSPHVQEPAAVISAVRSAAGGHPSPAQPAGEPEFAHRNGRPYSA